MKQYLSVLGDIYANGEYYPDRTGVGRTGLWVEQMRFNLREGFPLMTTKRVPLRWVAEELFWFLSGSTYEPHLMERGVDIWKEWATPEQTAKFGREEGELGPVYGHAWRNFGATKCGPFDPSRVRGTSPGQRHYSDKTRRWINTNYLDDGVDQIEWIVEDIQNNPYGTRKIISGWDPKEQNNVSLPPCHTLCHFKVHPNGDLSSYLYQRTADVALGVPFNIASYALLTYLIAHVTGYRVREFVHTLGDAHIYSNHLDGVKEQLNRTPFDLPTLTIDERLSNGGFDALMDVKYGDLTLEGYKFHPKISFDVAV